MAGIAGTIIRIKCRNFLTYDSMEVFPKDKLNVIIGPNGTGKSTLACAIVLGLGGKTSVIGRVKQLGDFVQHGQTKASVEIELYNPDGDNYVIQRVFDTRSESKWSLNGRQKTESHIKSLVSQLNIQVDNLCQFLPQDRVQDFAKMNKQQLFYNTLKSIGGVEMEKTIEKLKELQQTNISLKKNIESKAKSLDQEIVDNQRLEVEVKNSNERKSMLTLIENMEQKKKWLEYDEKTKEKDVLKKETEAIKKKYDAEKLKVKPLEDNLKQVNQQIKSIQNQIAPLNNNVQQIYTNYKRSKDECRKMHGENELVADQIKSLSDEEKSIRDDIKQKQVRMSAVENDLNCFDDTEAVEDTEELQNKMRDIMAQAQQAKSTKCRIEDSLENLNAVINKKERTLQQLENVRYQRELLLEELSKDAMKATKWLRENQHLFHGKIYEPMLLEINIKKTEFIPQIESIISRDDLMAFTCERAEDAGVLLKELRDVRKWRVNIVTMPDDRKRKSIKPQPYPIEYLSQFGFQCYASDVIEVPDGIRTYLDLNYDMRSIPIGGQAVTNHHYNSTIPTGISRYFSDECRYVVFTSQYSGNVISQTNPLKKTVDYFKASSEPELVRQHKVSIKELSRQKSLLNAQMCEIDEEIKSHENNYNDIRQQYKKAMSKQEQKKSAEKTFRHLESQVKQLQNGLNDFAGKESKLKNQIQINLKKLLEMSKKLPEHKNSYLSASKKVIVMTLSLNDRREVLQNIEAQFNESKQNLQRTEKAVEESQQRLSSCIHELKRLYKNALEHSNGLSPSEEPLRSTFSKFSDDLAKLETQISKQKAELACLPEVDENIFREYENRQKKIKSLEETVANYNHELSSTEATIEAIKSTWFPQISDYINQINRNYGQFFQEMNCAGEVSLYVPEDTCDFDNYGVTIRVKFREESELKELDGHRQSGGERAVSTALYMLAMQGLTSVPFRLVDEINQGMDAINERKVFQLLLNIIDKSASSCQYFLITPKLLRDMEYTNDTNVICIYNGANSLSHREFNIDQFVQIAQQLAMSS